MAQLAESLTRARFTIGQISRDWSRSPVADASEEFRLRRAASMTTTPARTQNRRWFEVGATLSLVLAPTCPERSSGASVERGNRPHDAAGAQLHPSHPSEPRRFAVVLSGVRGRGLVRAPDTAAKARLPRRGGLIDDIGQYVVVVLSPVIDERRVVAVRGVWDVTDSHRDWRGDGITQYDGVLRGKARELPQEVTRSKRRRCANDVLIDLADDPVSDEGSALRQHSWVEFTRPLSR